MKYKDYQAINRKLNESFFNLGVKTPRTIGMVGSKYSEMAPPDEDMSDDEESDEEGDEGGEGGDLDDMAAMVGGGDEGGEEDMGGDEMGDEMGGDDMGGDDMGGDDASMFGAGSPIASGPGLGRGQPGEDESDIDPASLDLDPHLMSLLGLGDLGVGQDDDMGAPGGATTGSGKHNTHVHHHIHHTMTPGAPGAAGAGAAKPAPDFGGDDEGEEDFGDDDSEGDDEEGGNPFAKKGGDDKGSKKGGKPFGGKKGGEESDDSDDSDSDSEDDSDDDSDEKPKFMNKGCCGNMQKEEHDLFASLIKMGRGDTHKKYKSGLAQIRENAMNDVPTTPKKVRREPKAGEVGFAPNAKLGANFQVMPFAEWIVARGKKL